MYSNVKKPLVAAATLLSFGHGALPLTSLASEIAKSSVSTVHHRTVAVDGLDIFYREAGSSDAPTLLLLHGFPTSSQMFRDLIPKLADRFHVVAPDFPGFGQSSMPARDKFAYTFENLSKIMERFAQQAGLSTYALYLMDYGAPVGYRLAVRHPERVTALIVQNGNAYEKGLREFWKPIKQYWANNTPAKRDALRNFLELDATKWQYTHGVKDVSLVSPDTWTTDQYLLDRPGNKEIQLDLFYDYRTNVPLYPSWQAYLREQQPPTLVVWGKNDQIFPAEGAEPYKRDLKNVEYHLIDTGHFALETHGDEIARLIHDFLNRSVARKSPATG